MQTTHAIFLMPALFSFVILYIWIRDKTQKNGIISAFWCKKFFCPWISEDSYHVHGLHFFAPKQTHVLLSNYIYLFECREIEQGSRDRTPMSWLSPLNASGDQGRAWLYPAQRTRARFPASVAGASNVSQRREPCPLLPLFCVSRKLEWGAAAGSQREHLIPNQVS